MNPIGRQMIIIPGPPYYKYRNYQTIRALVFRKIKVNYWVLKGDNMRQWGVSYEICHMSSPNP